jgi:hypothetical protein
MGKLQHDGDGCLEVGDKPRPSHLRRALIVTPRKGRKIRLDRVSPAVLG